MRNNQINTKVLIVVAMLVLTFGQSCGEKNPNVQTPEDVNQMDGVRESTEEAMETQMERSQTTDPNMREDSITKRDTMDTKNKSGVEN